LNGGTGEEPAGERLPNPDPDEDAEPSEREPLTPAVEVTASRAEAVALVAGVTAGSVGAEVDGLGFICWGRGVTGGASATGGGAMSGEEVKPAVGPGVGVVDVVGAVDLVGAGDVVGAVGLDDAVGAVGTGEVTAGVCRISTDGTEPFWSATAATASPAYVTSAPRPLSAVRGR